MSETVIITLIALFGLCIGSFLNVCIYRLPMAHSIVFPGSACTVCQKPIRFYDNLPVISYVVLRGRCRHCKAFISLRYPLVELLSGGFAVALYLRFGLSPAAGVYFLLIAALIIITFIDIDYQIIPDVISLPGIPIGFLLALLLPVPTVKDSLLGLLLGGGSLWLVATGYSLLTGRQGMGGGDIKLLAMLGTLIGWQGVLFTIFAGSATGTLAGLAVMLYQRNNMKLAIPFGPFLAIGAILYIFWGPEIIRWYLGW